ncbi:MAG: acyl carrier protein [Clostridia bacterium]|nr:acyl carrier protein [Clostridia bacterium]
MKDKVISSLAKQLRISPDEISLSSNIIDDLGADSLDLVEILMELENELGVSISDDDALKLKTVNDVIVFCESLNK